MEEDQEDNEKNSRKTWDLMIGITLVLLGSIRLYNRIQTESGIGFRAVFTLVFIIFGAYLIFRYFTSASKEK